MECHLKRAIESLITSAQNQCIRVYDIKMKIDGTRNDPKCQRCVKPTMKQSLIFFLNAKKNNERQHDWMGKTVHWDICRKKGFNVHRNGINTKFYLLQKMSPLKFSETLILIRKI